MLEDLKNKAETWTLEMADEFHSHIPRVHPRKGGYVWITQDDGFYHWGPDAVDFYRHDGRIFSVEHRPETPFLHDWAGHIRLSELAQSSGEFRISIPVTYTPVMINGNEWVYSEIQYPGYDIGYPASFENFVVHPYKTIKDYIDSMTILIKHLKNLNAEQNRGFPSKVKLGNIITDNQGPFWKDIKYWSYEYEGFAWKHLGEVQKLINRLPHNQIDPCQELVEYTKEQWKLK